MEEMHTCGVSRRVDEGSYSHKNETAGPLTTEMSKTILHHEAAAFLSCNIITMERYNADANYDRLSYEMAAFKKLKEKEVAAIRHENEVAALKKDNEIAALKKEKEKEIESLRYENEINFLRQKNKLLEREKIDAEHRRFMKLYYK
jgi:hypothetical protein